jgi:sugar lactone lactonase YvrE
MYQALEYSGYDVKLVMGTEAHNMKQGGAILPDALRWLWRGYPEPIVVHEPEAMHEAGWDPRGKVFATVFVDKPWQAVEGSYGSAESPAADRDGNVYFADVKAQKIMKVAPDGMVTAFKDLAGVAAVRVGADGRLFAYEPMTQRIVSFDAGGDEKIVARGVDVHDFAISAKGAIYFTDQEHKTLGMVDASGHVRVVYDGAEIAMPSGIALTPDQSMVVVSDAQSRFSWSFQIAADGSLENGEPFYRLEMPEMGWMSHAGGVAEDATGANYFATPQGIQVCEPSGRVIEILNAPEPGVVTGIAFAGGTPAWLYAAEGDKLYRRPVKVAPAVVWTPVKPAKPLL